MVREGRWQPSFVSLKDPREALLVSTICGVNTHWWEISLDSELFGGSSMEKSFLSHSEQWKIMKSLPGDNA